VGGGKGEEVRVMLRRVAAYAEKVFALSSKITDCAATAGYRPRAGSDTVFAAALMMCLCRMGSLNALEQTIKKLWGRLVGSTLPSADTFARAFSHLDTGGPRKLLKHIYTRLKRNKALGKLCGLDVAVIDGHETSSSFKFRCDGCLQRWVEKKKGRVEQYYHRNTTLMLVTPKLKVMLDADEQRPGEDETRCACRMLERAVRQYPRAFGVVLCDALYARAPFINMLLSHKKHIVCVLKDERRDLIKDAEGLFASQEPLRYRKGKTTYSVWDEENFPLWDGSGLYLRVVKSVETTTSVNRVTGEVETRTSTWMWMTTLSKSIVDTKTFVALAHTRWSIENNGFKEMVHLWHGDHVYHHQPTAIIAFWLTTMIAFNILHAFVELNIKPAFRQRHTFLHFAERVRADIYVDYPERTLSALPP
jgi:hypothetical protein